MEAHVALSPRMSSDSGQLMTGIHCHSESKSAGAALQTKVALLISSQQAARSASPSPPASAGCCPHPHPSIYQRDQCWRFREHPKVERSQCSSGAPRGLQQWERDHGLDVSATARVGKTQHHSRSFVPQSHTSRLNQSQVKRGREAD